MFDAHFVASENIGDFLTFWNNTDSNPASFVLPGWFLSMFDPKRVKESVRKPTIPASLPTNIL